MMIEGGPGNGENDPSAAPTQRVTTFLLFGAFKLSARRTTRPRKRRRRRSLARRSQAGIGDRAQSVFIRPSTLQLSFQTMA